MNYWHWNNSYSFITELIVQDNGSEQILEQRRSKGSAQALQQDILHANPSRWNSPAKPLPPSLHPAFNSLAWCALQGWAAAEQSPFSTGSTILHISRENHYAACDFVTKTQGEDSKIYV